MLCQINTVNTVVNTAAKSKWVRGLHISFCILQSSAAIRILKILFCHKTICKQVKLWDKLNEWLEKHNKWCCVITAVLHGEIKELISHHALMLAQKQWFWFPVKRKGSKRPQKPKGKDLQKWDTVRWVILHHLLEDFPSHTQSSLKSQCKQCRFSKTNLFLCGPDSRNMEQGFSLFSLDVANCQVTEQNTWI